MIELTKLAIDRAINEIASKLTFEKSSITYPIGDGEIIVELNCSNNLVCRELSIVSVEVCNGSNLHNIANTIRKHLSVDIARMNAEEQNSYN